MASRSSHQSKANGLGKDGRQTVDRHHKWWGGRWTSIASKALIPTETPMCSLCSTLHVLILSVLFLLWLSRARGEDDGLCTEQTKPPTPYLTAFPISPEHRVRSWRGKRLKRCRWRVSQNRWGGSDGKDHGTDPSRFLRGCSVFLTKRAERTATTMTNTRCIQEAYGAIPLKSALLRIEGVICWTAQGSIGLDRKSGPWKSSCI